MTNKKDVEYKIDYEIILYGVEPFTNIGSKIRLFIDDLNKHNLVSSCSWNIIDTPIVKYKKTKYIFKKIKLK